MGRKVSNFELLPSEEYVDGGMAASFPQGVAGWDVVGLLSSGRENCPCPGGGLHPVQQCRQGSELRERLQGQCCLQLLVSLYPCWRNNLGSSGLLLSLLWLTIFMPLRLSNKNLLFQGSLHARFFEYLKLKTVIRPQIAVAGTPLHNSMWL